MGAPGRHLYTQQRQIAFFIETEHAGHRVDPSLDVERSDFSAVGAADHMKICQDLILTKKEAAVGRQWRALVVKSGDGHDGGFDAAYYLREIYFRGDGLRRGKEQQHKQQSG